jgi:chromosome segregation ATPase
MDWRSLGERIGSVPDSMSFFMIAGCFLFDSYTSNQFNQELLHRIDALEAERSENRIKLSSIDSNISTLLEESRKTREERTDIYSRITGLERDIKNLEIRVNKDGRF